MQLLRRRFSVCAVYSNVPGTGMTLWYVKSSLRPFLVNCARGLPTSKLELLLTSARPTIFSHSRPRLHSHRSQLCHMGPFELPLILFEFLSTNLGIFASEPAHRWCSVPCGGLMLGRVPTVHLLLSDDFWVTNARCYPAHILEISLTRSMGSGDVAPST